MKTGRFTEGTNLFNIGNIFILEELEAPAPTDVAANEEVTNYPSSVNLINAVKVEELKRIRYWISECYY
jgi:hypothetical protein